MPIPDTGSTKLNTIYTNTGTAISNLSTIDTNADDSYTLLELIEEHVHSAAKVYPTGAAAITVTAGNAAPWRLGNYAEIIPAGTVSLPFDIHFINVETCTVNTTYELVLYASTTEIGRLRFYRTNLREPGSGKPIKTPIVVANTQIQAKLATATGNADQIQITIGYHTY